MYDGLSGYIELDIEAKSPLFVRGTLTQEEVEQNIESKDKEDHYKPAGQIRLPGSSIRGMVRSLYEIVSYSKLGFIDDRKLFFRSFADTSVEFKSLYSHMLGGTKHTGFRPMVYAGYLEKTGREYTITQARSFHRVEESMVIEKKVFNTAMGDEKYSSEIEAQPYIRVVYKAEAPKAHSHSRGNKLYYSKVVDIQKHSGSVPTGYQEGYLVLSGWSTRKHMHWVIGPRNNTKYTVSEKMIEEYKNDDGREAINLLESPKTDWVKPCFFTLKNNEVRAFGHTGVFRIAYCNKIGDLLPDDHKNPKLQDMTEALFGKVSEGDGKASPGRVYFEDAIANEAQELKSEHPRVLSGPKPNSFQLYLKQNVADIRVAGRNRTGIKNYDTDGAQLVGRKLYWHRDHSDWIADQKDVEKHPTQYTRIKPIKQGAKFKARIRFDNLSKVELGALLFVLDLPQGCCHKIGMGKPLGLGSIRITPTLTLIDRRERYSSLKNLAETREDDLSRYKTAFEQHLKEKKVISTNSAWDSPELKELKVMLDYAKRPSQDKTKYMLIQGADGNQYKDRKILKRPSEYPRH